MEMINDISVFIDKHIQIVRVSIGVTGLLGVALIVRKAHLLKVYKRISDVPDGVIKKQLRLRGIVRNVSENGLLKLEHQSVILRNYFRVAEDEYLNVRLAGIKPMSGWLSYMNDNLLGKKVRFVLLNKDDVSDVIIYKRMGIFSRMQCMNGILLRNGVAVVEPTPPNIVRSVVYNDLVRKLVKIEVEADKRGAKGVWKRESWFRKWMKW